VLLYRLLWISLKFVYRAFFKRIYFSNLDRLSQDKPVILASNHPNSFLDSVVLPVFMLKQQFYLARGDVFNNKILQRVFNWLNMIPIYRKRDSANNSDKNNETFDRVAHLLNRNETVLIFSEGVCMVEKRLRPLMKGTARMAFHAAEKYGWDRGIQIQPVGLNYTYMQEVRGEVMYNFGLPMEVSDYEDLYKENPSKAIVALTEELEIRMKKEIIHLDPENDALFEQLVQMFRNDREKKNFGILQFNDYSRFQMEKGLADQLNDLHQNNPEDWEKLKLECEDLEAQMAKHVLGDLGFSKRSSTPFWKLVLMMFFLPFSLVAYLLHFGIFKFARSYSRKIIKSSVFHASMHIGFIMIPMWFAFLIPFLLVMGFTNVYWAIAWTLFQLISGYIGVLSLDLWNQIKIRSRVEVFKNKEPALYDELAVKRSAILKHLAHETH